MKINRTTLFKKASYRYALIRSNAPIIGILLEVFTILFATSIISLCMIISDISYVIALLATTPVTIFMFCFFHSSERIRKTLPYSK